MPNLVNIIDSQRWDVVEHFINKGVSVNVSDLSGHTPLMLSVMANRPGLVDQLITAGADVDYANVHGLTALMIAAQDGREQICGILIDAGAELDYIDDDGNTALILAVHNKDEELVKLLLEAGAYVNHSNADEESALAISIRLECEEITAALILAGADDNQINDLSVRGEMLDNSDAWDEEEDEDEEEDAQDWFYDDEDSSDGGFGWGGLDDIDCLSDSPEGEGEMHYSESSGDESDRPFSHAYWPSGHSASAYIVNASSKLPSIALVGIVDLNLTPATDPMAPAAGLWAM